MKQEWHITIEGDPHRWRGFCAHLGIKPLWIELNTFETQLMCAITGKNLVDQCCDIDAFRKDIAREFKEVRFKHEVEMVKIDVSTHDKPEQFIYTLPTQIDGARYSPDAVLYYECHVKLDGKFERIMNMASRDLYRHVNNRDRWYVTHRESVPFGARLFTATVISMNGRTSEYAGHEYEACVLDTNPELDANWTNEFARQSEAYRQAYRGR